MTTQEQLQDLIAQNLTELKELLRFFLIIYDWDGVFTSTERMSHFAALNVLALYNDDMLSEVDKMEFSNRLFGIKVVNQRPIMEEFFREKGLDVYFPKHFDGLRDAEQLRMFEGLQTVEGMHEMAYTLNTMYANQVIASRSRVEPFVAKVTATDMDLIIKSDDWFLPAKVDDKSQAWDNMHLIFEAEGVSPEDQGFDKVEIFSYAAASKGIVPAGCIVIEDSVKGIISAKKAGMIPICFLGAEDTDNETTRKALEGILPEEQICETADELLLTILKIVMSSQR
ncbi:MAG TPA: hypothetical protein DCL21_02170 [Alphaproteobacteria bacterium]|nr:hypothetical protein [Alphaproteobacteria bacterium]